MTDDASHAEDATAFAAPHAATEMPRYAGRSQDVWRGACRHWPTWVSGGLLIAAVIWLAVSPGSYHVVAELLKSLRIGGGPRTQAEWVLCAGGIFVTIALVRGAVGLVRGPSRQRSIAGYLRFTAIVCGWLALATGWEAVYGWGQLRRVTADLPAFEAMAKRLDAAWPTEDGSSGDFGPYMAYPKGAPTCLLMLGQTKLPGSSLLVSAVERSDGAIRFELSGAERTAWVVWRADDAPAETFNSGLGGNYVVAGEDRVAPHWRLVRYTLR